MLLLYQTASNLIQIQHHIYIPLCFYFIDVRKRSPSNIALIYIPLCFYFINMFSAFPLPCPQFTFHYASTLSWVAVDHSDLGTLFTFHYASTLSMPDELKQAIVCNLHSTMLLLYLLSPDMPGRISSIYIPLCFYFIRKRMIAEKRYSSIYIPLCFYFICKSMG